MVVVVVVVVVVVETIFECFHRDLRPRSRHSCLVLSFKKLDVYRCSIDFLALATELVEQFPRGQSKLSDQFDRASMSIALNIAEGVGRTTKRDQAKHYAIARGSAMECAAILEVCQIRTLVPPTKANEGEQLLYRIVQMLSRLAYNPVSTT